VDRGKILKKGEKKNGGEGNCFVLLSKCSGESQSGKKKIDHGGPCNNPVAGGIIRKVQFYKGGKDTLVKKWKVSKRERRRKKNNGKGGKITW